MRRRRLVPDADRALRQEEKASDNEYGDDRDAIGRLNAMPPSLRGLSRKSPTVARAAASE